MRERKIDYDKAHEIASHLEYDLREGRGLDPLLAPGRRELTKRHLRKLTAPETFAYVLKHYVKP